MVAYEYVENLVYKEYAGFDISGVTSEETTKVQNQNRKYECAEQLNGNKGQQSLGKSKLVLAAKPFLNLVGLHFSFMRIQNLV